MALGLSTGMLMSDEQSVLETGVLFTMEEALRNKADGTEPLSSPELWCSGGPARFLSSLAQWLPAWGILCGWSFRLPFGYGWCTQQAPPSVHLHLEMQ